MYCMEHLNFSCKLSWRGVIWFQYQVSTIEVINSRLLTFLLPFLMAICFCSRVSLLLNVIWGEPIYLVLLVVLALQLSQSRMRLFGQMGDIFSRFTFKSVISLLEKVITIPMLSCLSLPLFVVFALCYYQAEKQLSSSWILMRAGNSGVPTTSEWLSDVLAPGCRIGIDPVSNTQLFIICPQNVGCL